MRFGAAIAARIADDVSTMFWRRCRLMLAGMSQIAPGARDGAARRTRNENYVALRVLRR